MRARPMAIELGAPGYPDLLAAIYDPPRCLYLRGNGRDRLGGPCVAVVGARSCSAYGAQVARALGRDLAAAGAVVVSGLARGIDGEAHRGALDAAGKTVAVLGCGIDRDYPQRTRRARSPDRRDRSHRLGVPAGDSSPRPGAFRLETASSPACRS